MNDTQWEKYQQKLTALHNKYKKRRRTAWLVWILYFAVTTALVFWLISLPYSIAAEVFNLMLSWIVLNQRLKHDHAVENTQEQLLMDDAPVGKIRL